MSGTYVDRDLLAFENGPLAASLGRPQCTGGAPDYPNEGRARGDPNTLDWYQYTGLSITYIISRFSDCERTVQLDAQTALIQGFWRSLRPLWRIHRT